MGALPLLSLFSVEVFEPGSEAVSVFVGMSPGSAIGV